MRRDWTALREKYVQGRMTLRELSEEAKISYSAVYKRAADEDWTALREAFRESVHEEARKRAVKRRGRREAEALAALEETNEKLLEEIQKALEDEHQLYLHLVSAGKGEQEERTLSQMNTGNLRNLVESLAKLQEMIATHGNILDKRTAEELRLKKQRMKLDREKAGLEDSGNEGETGVAHMPDENALEPETLTLREI